MPKSFLVSALDRAHVDQALPLIQTLRRYVTLEEWHGIALPYLPPERHEDYPWSRGIIACRTGSGYIRGLFCYGMTDSAAGRVLTVNHFAAAGLFDVTATTDSLIDALDILACDLDCRRVEIDAATCAAASFVPGLDMTTLFGRRGYRTEGRILVKETPPAAMAWPAGFVAQGTA